MKLEIQYILLALSAALVQQAGATPRLDVRQQQHPFPPSNGPCPQNRGLAPPSCSDNKTCVDIPAAGICAIQTQEGFPICGCCEAEPMACQFCGGDVGGGICGGIGPNGVGYQGCPCSSTGGEIPPGNNQTNICPEENGQPTQSCDDPNCGGDTDDQGICTSHTVFNNGANYRHCACCPSNSTLICNECGGDAGGGVCVGVEEYRGDAFRGCHCSNSTSGTPPIIIIPFPIPPPAFPIPPPVTPHPEEPCPEGVTEKCSDCGGLDNWCQSGPHVGCPCLNDCPADGSDDQPSCQDEDCEGDDQGQCTIGPNQGCNCKGPAECPSGVDIPQCNDSTCGGPTNQTTISSCKGDSSGNNKDCTCFNLIAEGPPDQPGIDLSAQQTFINNLDDGTGSCVSAFFNETTFPITTTGNTLSFNLDASIVPLMFNASSLGATWRLTDTSELSLNWTATFLPNGNSVNHTNAIAITWSMGDTEDIQTVQLEAALSIPADGSCPTTINLVLQGICQGELGKLPDLTPHPGCSTISQAAVTSAAVTTSPPPISTTAAPVGPPPSQCSQLAGSNGFIPACSTCGGQNNVCQVGGLQGCQCVG